MKIVLNDSTEYDVKDGILPGSITVYLNTYGDIQALEESLRKTGNLDNVKLGDNVIKNLALLNELSFSATRNDGKVEVMFMLRGKTEQEIANDSKKASIETVVTYLTDKQALTVKDLCKNWLNDPDGYSYRLSNPEDLRRQYNEKLWKLQKDHEKQQTWYPGSDPTLWVEIVENHDGSISDPIPVPDSVTTSGFEYVYGKYYKENDRVYLCERQGIPNPEDLYGQVVKLYYFPSALIGQYFVLEE